MTAGPEAAGIVAAGSSTAAWPDASGPVAVESPDAEDAETAIAGAAKA